MGIFPFWWTQFYDSAKKIRGASEWGGMDVENDVIK